MVVHSVPPASRKKPASQILFDRVDTFLTLILHVSDHVITVSMTKNDIAPENALYFTMCYRKLYSCLDVKSKAIYQNKHSYFFWHNSC